MTHHATPNNPRHTTHDTLHHTHLPTHLHKLLHSTYTYTDIYPRLLPILPCSSPSLLFTPPSLSQGRLAQSNRAPAAMNGPGGHSGPGVSVKGPGSAVRRPGSKVRGRGVDRRQTCDLTLHYLLYAASRYMTLRSEGSKINLGSCTAA